MGLLQQQYVNKLYNQFHDIFKVVKDQQVAFDTVTKDCSRSFKNILAADLFVKGYTQIRVEK